VIDMQNDLVKHGGSLLVPDAEATVPAITRLLDGDLLGGSEERSRQIECEALHRLRAAICLT
jgi:hypothetical protein